MAFSTPEQGGKPKTHLIEVEFPPPSWGKPGGFRTIFDRERKVFESLLKRF